MKVGFPLLAGLVVVLAVPCSPLQAQDDAAVRESVNHLEASKYLQSDSSQPAPQYPAADVKSSSSFDFIGYLNSDPLGGGSILAPPPADVGLDEFAPPVIQERKIRRVNRPKDPNKDDDSDWLAKGMEEQRKLMEHAQKANSTMSNPFEDDSDNADSPTPGSPQPSKKTLSMSGKILTNSSLFGNDSGSIFSHYTTGGLEGIKTTSTSFSDPMSMGANDNIGFGEVKKSMIDAKDPTKIDAPIIDPLAMIKSTLAMSNSAPIMPNSRLTPNDWMTNEKDRERLGLSPPQPPNVTDLYSLNQIKLKTPDPKPTFVTTTTSGPINARPSAATIKNSLPPNRTIRDPND